jgi:predicted DNA-binding protein (UPF0251 family)
MPRPRKYRRVEFLPDVTYFKPAGIQLHEVVEVHLSIEEAEAVRLKDLEGLDQEQAAGEMDISRPTFQRILGVARRKIADVLLNGKAIRIQGGNFQMAWRRFRCQWGHEWELETPVAALPELCPECRETDVEPVLSRGIVSDGRKRGFGRARHFIKTG